MITMARPEWSIGALSRLTGCKIETIRYYERIGLWPAPHRSEGGHRLYGADHRRRLTLICRARALGFTLAEVRTLLSLAAGDHSCAEVKALAERHLLSIRAKILDLSRMEATLATTVAQCAGDAAPTCPILDTLIDDEAQAE